MGFTRSPITGSAPLTTSFVNTSTVTGNGPVNYRWIFGDGTTSSLAAAPDHGYERGLFIIQLQATGSYNSSSAVSLNVSSSAPWIIANFTESVKTGAAPLSVTFTDTSVYSLSSTNPGSLTYKWLQGSGSITSSAAAPTFTYTSASSYTVTFQVTASKYSISASCVSASVIVVTP